MPHRPKPARYSELDRWLEEHVTNDQELADALLDRRRTEKEEALFFALSHALPGFVEMGPSRQTRLG